MPSADAALLPDALADVTVDDQIAVETPDEILEDSERTDKELMEESPEEESPEEEGPGEETTDVEGTVDDSDGL